MMGKADLALVVVAVLFGASSQVLGMECVVEGEVGQCVRAAHCSAVKELLESARASTSALPVQRLRAYLAACPFNPTDVRVCCPTNTQPGPPSTPPTNTQPGPPSTPPTNTQPGPPSTPPQPGPPSTPPNIPLSLPLGLQKIQAQCGLQPLGDRIVDGKETKPFAWPWTVLLRGRDARGQEAWHCGGVLFTQRYVLTAAHCLQDPSVPGLTVLHARVGEHDLGVNPECLGRAVCQEAIDVPIEEAHVHPDYDEACRACSDIAVLRLAHDVSSLAPLATPVCLPLAPEDDLRLSVTQLQDSQRRAVVAGWGSVSRDPFSVQLPSALHQAFVPLSRTPFCQQQLQRHPNPTSILCAGGEGPAACRGDSGGPLMLQNHTTTRWYLLGVISKGAQVCGAPRTQTLFTNVHHFLPWIISVLQP